ncbi:hypothetical protein [Paludisphaera sp.]|uniref:hypothetical protein n=1 Tax=Paludisphaera sp. TaxID=2017432 RepID=UPI00301D38F9
MRSLLPAAFVGALFIGYQAARSQQPAEAKDHRSASQAAATTYEHLATAIIEIEATEDQLVRSILIGYEMGAQEHLKAAARDAGRRVAHLEAAAAEVTNIANEGDKAIQAIRQRLAKAGHTHNTDVETKEDYIWVTNREKKALLDVAARIARADEQADLAALGAELTKAFDAAVAPE